MFSQWTWAILAISICHCFYRGLWFQWQGSLCEVFNERSNEFKEGKVKIQLIQQESLALVIGPTVMAVAKFFVICGQRCNECYTHETKGSLETREAGKPIFTWIQFGLRWFHESPIIVQTSMNCPWHMTTVSWCILYFCFRLTLIFPWHSITNANIYRPCSHNFFLMCEGF